MNKMIRRLGLLTALCLLVMPCALAEEKSVSMNGMLEPDGVTAIAATASGSMIECAEAGERIQAGDALGRIDTLRIYAPCDGTAAAIRAKAGDGLGAITATYGGALYIEPKSEYIIQASTQGAYDSNDNRMIHVGEKVYLTSVNNSERTGEGLITSVTGESYTVEVVESNIRLNETCRISRESDHTETKGRIGQGKTQRNNPVPVAAEGSLVKLHVREGDQVKRGDLLMEIVPDTLDTGDTNVISAEEDMIVLSCAAGVGVPVQKGQTIMQAFPVGSLQAVVYAYEEDLTSIQEGDPVKVTLDIDPDEYVYEGTVDQISYIPTEGSGSVMYKVRVSFENDGFVRMGMSVTVETEN